MAHQAISKMLCMYLQPIIAKQQHAHVNTALRTLTITIHIHSVPPIGLRVGCLVGTEDFGKLGTAST